MHGGMVPEVMRTWYPLLRRGILFIATWYPLYCDMPIVLRAQRKLDRDIPRLDFVRLELKLRIAYAQARHQAQPPASVRSGP